MAIERTLSIIKPSAVRDNHIGGILAKYEAAGLKIVAAKMMQLTQSQAEGFYAVHSARPFFGELVEFITGGPLVAMVLEGVEAVRAARQLIGATDPVEAETGSIRGDFGTEVTFNLVHGSDSDESAAREISIWFPEL